MSDFWDIPCYIINCEKDVERKGLCEKRVKEQPFKHVSFFSASDGYILPSSAFEAENIYHVDDGVKNSGSCGAKGVALSHKRLWKHISEQSEEYAIVFEDDVTFHPHFSYFAPIMWKETLNQSKGNPKMGKSCMAYLGYCCFHHQNNKGGRHMQPQICEGMPLAIHAYLLHKEVAKWLYENFGTMHENVDIHMQKMYHEIHHEWKCYMWWNGAYVWEAQHQKRFNVYFNGFCSQDHQMSLSIHRERNEK